MRKLTEVCSPPIVRAKFLNDNTCRPTEGAELDELRRAFSGEKQKKLASRRAFVAWAGTLGVSPWLLKRAALGAANTTIPGYTVAAASGGAFPGQAGNFVGYQNAPGQTGLTAGGALVNGTTYSFKDFTNLSISGKTNITLIGCRSQSNSTFSYNTNVTGSGGLNFSYCSWTPLASLYTDPPGGGGGGGSTGVWPSSAAGGNTQVQVDNTNCIPGASGYQFSLAFNSLTGPATVDHCDFWGWANAITTYSTTPQINVTNNWIHDARNANIGSGDHTDGIGYLNGTPTSGVATANVLVQGNTIATIGDSTDGIAWQAAASGYNNVQNIGNYLAGFGYPGAFFLPGSTVPTNCVVRSNIFSTIIQAYWGTIYANPTSFFTGTTNSWRLNTYLYYPGSTARSGASPVSPGSNGLFIYPDSTYHVTDFTG